MARINRIKAVKAFREATGASLTESVAGTKAVITAFGLDWDTLQPEVDQCTSLYEKLLDTFENPPAELSTDQKIDMLQFVETVTRARAISHYTDPLHLVMTIAWVCYLTGKNDR